MFCQMQVVPSGCVSRSSAHTQFSDILVIPDFETLGLIYDLMMNVNIILGHSMALLVFY